MLPAGRRATSTAALRSSTSEDACTTSPQLAIFRLSVFSGVRSTLHAECGERRYCSSCAHSCHNSLRPCLWILQLNVVTSVVTATWFISAAPLCRRRGPWWRRGAKVEETTRRILVQRRLFTFAARTNERRRRSSSASYRDLSRCRLYVSEAAMRRHIATTHHRASSCSHGTAAYLAFCSWGKPAEGPALCHEAKHEHSQSHL